MYLGIDVGGTTIKVGLYNQRYELIQKDIYQTDQIQDNFIDGLTKIIQKYETKDLQGLGIGLPGFVLENGYIQQLPNIKVEKINIIDQLKKVFNFKIKVANDANAALIAYQYLSHNSMQNIMLISIGTGLGAGLSYNQQLLIGKHGMVGEIGHLKIALEQNYAFKCSCQKLNCLETIVSNNGIVNLYHYYQNEYQDSILHQQSINGYNLYQAVAKEDALAIKIANIQAQALALAIDQINTILDLDKIVLAGGIASENKYLLKQVQTEYQKLSLKQYHDLEIVLANEQNLGMLGAALLIERNE